MSGQDRDRVLWLLLGNVPPICRGVDELAEGVRLALVISERYMRGSSMPAPTLRAR